jgi:hypothetical protein
VGVNANGTTLCHWNQLYRYFVSQPREFCRHNPLCCFSTRVYCCKRIFRYDSIQKLLDTPSYVKCQGIPVVKSHVMVHMDTASLEASKCEGENF